MPLKANASPYRGLLAALALWLLVPKTPARAEQSITYKFQQWREDNGRVAVDSNYGLIESDLTPDLKFKLMGVVDMIAGATPTGVPPPTPGGQVGLSTLKEKRKAWEGDFSLRHQRFTLTTGYAESRESDYDSNGWSVNTLTDFNERNTSLLLGYARTDDEIKTKTKALPLDKTGNDLVIGVTQLLNPQTSVTLNVTHGRSHGYLSDPYKLVLKTYDFFGTPFPVTFSENRPSEKNKNIVFLGLNQAYERLNGTIDASYRYYTDDFGIRSQTLAVEWFQTLSEHWIVRPAVRFYRQSAADFYYPDLNKTSIDPDEEENRPPGVPRAYYSSDYRLAAMDTTTLGLKVIWKPVHWLALDITYERYLMQGRDATAASAFANADILTFGLKISR